MKKPKNLKWARFILFLAALYNLLWGGIVSLFPATLYFGNPPSSFLDILIRCTGMLVGVYGIAYFYASRNPTRYWPLIFVGFIGKVLGPFGSLYYIMKGDLNASFFTVNVFNDIIWIVPFGWILFVIYKDYEMEKTSIPLLSLYQTILQEKFKNL